MSSTKIDVVIPYFNRPEKTEKLLRSLQDHYGTSRSKLFIRPILVDDGSDGHQLCSNGFVRWSAIYPNPLCVRLSGNLGFVKATNAGLAVSDAHYVVLQNNDTEVYPGTYENMLEALRQHEKLGVVGPVSSETDHSWQGCRRLFERVRGVTNSPALPVEPEFFKLDHLARSIYLDKKGLPPIWTEINMVAFFCTMIRREVIDKVGFLSNDFGVGLGDDDDYCARVRKAGWDIGLVRSAYVRHDGRSTFGALYTPDQLAAMSRGAIKKLTEKYGRDGFGG